MTNFEKYLQQRNSSGSVKFDFEEQSMTMVVQTQKHDGNTQVSDVKNLSGGERSYATFCFLLALGHVVSE
jgi:chromosome segregation ATPase